MEKELLEKMKAEVKEENDWPYFPEPEETAEEFFEELKKEYPSASIHKKTGMGTAICTGNYARMILETMIIGAEKCILYSTDMACTEVGNIEIEHERIINLLDAEEDDTCFKVGG